MVTHDASSPTTPMAPNTTMAIQTLPLYPSPSRASGESPTSTLPAEMSNPNACPMWLAMENLALALVCVADMMLPFLAGSDTTTMRAQHIP